MHLFDLWEAHPLSLKFVIVKTSNILQLKLLMRLTTTLKKSSL